VTLGLQSFHRYAGCGGHERAADSRIKVMGTCSR
jgi:hypothetical protein